jgi:hypothetical protein
VVLDTAVGEQVLKALTPAAIELSLTAASDIERERARLDKHWREEMERAGYEARLAERSYRAVDPDNRLVARTLEQRMRRLLEAAVAAGRSAAQIAECLNREGFRLPTARADRFNPENARELVYRLGLSPRIRPAVSLAADEWWIRDLADDLGVGYSRFKEWVRKGYVHTRRVGSRRHLVIWADAQERDRLRRLRDAFGGRTLRYPAELTCPKARPEQKRGRKAKASQDEVHERPGQ